MTDYNECILYTDNRLVAVHARFNHLLTRIAKLETRIEELEKEQGTDTPTP